MIRWPWRYVRVEAYVAYNCWSHTVTCGPTIWGPFTNLPTPREMAKAKEVVALQEGRPDMQDRNMCGWSVIFRVLDDA